MSEEKDKEQNGTQNESELARLIRAKEGDAAFEAKKTAEYKPKTFGERWENFWYHHKWTTIIVSVFAVFIIIASTQLLTNEKPDIYAIYAGPDYINSSTDANIKSALKSVMSDYNGDGEIGLLFMNVTYLNDEQVEQVYAEAEREGVEVKINPQSNYDELKRFNMEIFAGESVLCLLDPGLYETLRDADGIMPLEEIFDGVVPASLDEASVDGYGLYLYKTEFGKYFGGAMNLEPDTVICLRRVSSMAAFKGEKKIERIHEYHVQMFRAICEFVIPE